MTLPKKLACLATLAAVFPASAAFTLVDDVDIPIPANFNGVYIDLIVPPTTETLPQSGAADNANGAYVISFGEPAGDWDFNFFFGGVGIAHNKTVNPYREDASDNLSAIHALGVGELIDGSTPTTSGAAPLTTPGFGGSGSGSGGGSGVSTSGNHIGTNPEQFQPGIESYIGFVLDDPDDINDTVMYGWISVTFQDNGTQGLINSFAFSETPILVPEPSTSLFLLSSLFLLRRKR